MCDSWNLARYARRGALNTSKAERLLGYRPGVSIEEGMRETGEWLCDQMGYELDLAGPENK